MKFIICFMVSKKSFTKLKCLLFFTNELQLVLFWTLEKKCIFACNYKTSIVANSTFLMSVAHSSNHLYACSLHRIETVGGTCGSSYFPLHSYFPACCEAAPARG